MYKTTKILLVLIVFQWGQIEAKKFDTLKNKFIELDLPQVQLDFKNVLNTHVDDSRRNKQSAKIDQLLMKSKAVNIKNQCEKIILSKIVFDLKVHKLRNDLLGQYHANPSKYSGSINDLPNSKQWYRLLTQRWLGEDVSATELQRIGENEFVLAKKEFDRVKKIISKKDITTASSNSKIIKKAYKQAEKTVMKNLPNLFANEWYFKAVTIEKSTLGNNFPAPGYYNLDTETFYFNPLKDNYNLSQVDWLFIHEAVPGHHYQNKISEQYGMCKGNQVTQTEMAFTEGWAAYTETLGQQLQLFQDENSYYFALKWQVLRAMRVIIDVGIHAQGWSVKQAEQYWLDRFPEGQDIMAREIKRIQRWPMQVNTYVYGKYKIEQLKKHLQQLQGKNFNVKAFHKNIISLSQLPLASIKDYQILFLNNMEKTP